MTNTQQDTTPDHNRIDQEIAEAHNNTINSMTGRMEPDEADSAVWYAILVATRMYFVREI